MKKVLLLPICIILFSSVTFPAYAAQVVCDEETGICRLVEDDAAEEKAAADKSAVKADEKLKLLRKQVGFTGKREFMDFLRGEANSNRTDAAFWGMLLIALIGGLALNLTPCVLPMLPINLAIIGASGGKAGFRRGLLYGCGMAVVYGVLGVLAAFAGVSFGAMNSSPIFNFAIALIFVILSLSMAGVFNLDPGSRFRVNPANSTSPRT